MTEKVTNKSKKARRATKPTKKVDQKQLEPDDAGPAYDKIEALEETLQEFRYLIGDTSCDTSNADDVLRAYKLEKSLSSIEIYDMPKNRVLTFIEKLREFFFVSKITDSWSGSRVNEDEFNGMVFVSRFHNLVPVAEEYELSDNCADLSGVLHGYPIKEVAKYCLKLENRSESPKSGLFK